MEELDLDELEWGDWSMEESMRDYMPNNYYDRSGNTKICYKCYSDKFDEITTDMINGIVAEAEVICRNCGEEVNYWAYGSYQYNSLEHLKEV